MYVVSKTTTSRPIRATTADGHEGKKGEDRWPGTIHSIHDKSIVSCTVVIVQLPSLVRPNLAESIMVKLSMAHCQHVAAAAQCVSQPLTAKMHQERGRCPGLLDFYTARNFP